MFYYLFSIVKRYGNHKAYYGKVVYSHYILYATLTSFVANIGAMLYHLQCEGIFFVDFQQMDEVARPPDKVLKFCLKCSSIVTVMR